VTVRLEGDPQDLMRHILRSDPAACAVLVLQDDPGAVTVLHDEDFGGALDATLDLLRKAGCREDTVAAYAEVGRRLIEAERLAAFVAAYPHSRDRLTEDALRRPVRRLVADAKWVPKGLAARVFDLERRVTELLEVAVVEAKLPSRRPLGEGHLQQTWMVDEHPPRGPPATDRTVHRPLLALAAALLLQTCLFPRRPQGRVPPPRSVSSEKSDLPDAVLDRVVALLLAAQRNGRGPEQARGLKSARTRGGGAPRAS
jgi:hypothetical protein